MRYIEGEGKDQGDLDEEPSHFFVCVCMCVAFTLSEQFTSKSDR